MTLYVRIGHEGENKMEPIIPPIWIYLADIADGIKMTSFTVAMLSFLPLIFFMMGSTMGEGEEKKNSGAA